MFTRNNIDEFDDATPVSNKGKTMPTNSRLKLRKPLKTVLQFFTMNAIIVPPSYLVVTIIAAKGIEDLLEVTHMKMSRMPIPFASQIEQYEGFRDISLSQIISGLLCLLVTFIWFRVILELKGEGNLLNDDNVSRVLVWLYGTVAAVIIVLDVLIFGIGIASRGSGWGEMPAYIPYVCSALYAASVVCFAIFHADYFCSDKV